MNLEFAIPVSRSASTEGFTLSRQAVRLEYALSMLWPTTWGIGMPTEFLQQYRGELTILVLGALTLLCLLFLVPQLLRSHQKALELAHQEHMRALEQGLPPVVQDDRSVFAGRTALLVPIVSICTAGTVTCFLVA